MRNLVAVVACGAMLAGAGCTTSSRLDEKTWCAKIAEVECSWIYSCCNLGERLSLTGLNAHEESEPTCREQLTAQCLDDWNVPLASMAAGRMTFNNEQANSCLDNMKTTASQCPAVMEQPDDCKKIVGGLVGIDGECAYDEECAGQARCQRVTDGASGRCYDKSGQDGLCQTSLDCQDGLFCYQGTTTQYVCVALPTVGLNETCGTSGVVCDQGLYCDTETYKCAARLGSGQQCSSYGTQAQCADGLVCEYTSLCGSGLPVGQTCSYSQVCASGSYCDTTTYKCTAVKGSGSTCYQASECDANSYCDTNTERCVARHNAGEGCSTAASDSCQKMYACQPRGSCQPRGDVGSECYSDDMCLDRLDCNSTNHVCEMQPLKSPTGAFCLDGTDCESGKCESNECVGYCTGEI
jgi:hypothetical protein